MRIKAIVMAGIACFLVAGYRAAASAAVHDGAGESRTVLEAALHTLHLAGGISAGEFSASNPGPATSGNETLLSNFLFELSSGNNGRPIGFTAAVGETSTPSLLSPPGTTADLDLEYGSLSWKPRPDMTIEAGLLKPDAGFEDAYTYNNANVILGALASQQPFNAYGIKLQYTAGGLHLEAAYYGKRLDDTEYTVNGTAADHAWESGIGTTIKDVSYRLYHYHIAGYRSLTGAVIEHTYKNVPLAVNIDWWRWDSALADQHGRRSAVGGAFYAVPGFGKFSLPVRLEYIDQGSSGIYVENPEAARIYTATLSPTYRFTKESYLRFETAFVRASHGFADKDGKTKDKRVYLAMELGYVF